MLHTFLSLTETHNAHCHRKASKKNTFEETYLIVFPREFPKIVAALNTLVVMCILTLCRTVFPGMTFWGLLASNFQGWPSYPVLCSPLEQPVFCPVFLQCDNLKAELNCFPWKILVTPKHLGVGRTEEGFCIEWPSTLICSVNPVYSIVLP